MRAVLFAVLGTILTFGPFGFCQVVNPDPTKRTNMSNKDKADKEKKAKEDKDKKDKEKKDPNADIKPVQATIKAIDEKRGLFIVNMVHNGGNYIYEYKINDKTDFKSADGKEMKGGFGNDAFKQRDERSNVAVDLKMEMVDGKPVIKEIRLSK